MGTTTKMAIPYPEATGLVKDGWEDMKDIATQVDAKSGLILINTTSFSAVASQSINDVFSANYDNYQIVLNNVTGSGSNQIHLRLRVSGTDASGTNYNRQIFQASSTSVSSARATGLTTMERISVTTGAVPVITDIFMANPFQAAQTTARSFHTVDSGTNLEYYGWVCNHTLTTSYTGFTLISSAGTISGSVSVYGYNK